MIAKIKNPKGAIRTARGFSKAELAQVGLSFKQALNKHIPIDKRRKTEYDFNVEELKKGFGKK